MAGTRRTIAPRDGVSDDARLRARWSHRTGFQSESGFTRAGSIAILVTNSALIPPPKPEPTIKTSHFVFMSILFPILRYFRWHRARITGPCFTGDREECGKAPKHAHFSGDEFVATVCRLGRVFARRGASRCRVPFPRGPVRDLDGPPEPPAEDGRDGGDDE